MAVHRRFWMRGEAGYFLGTLNELRRWHNSELEVTLIGDGDDRVVEAALPVRGLRQRPLLRRRHADLPRRRDR